MNLLECLVGLALSLVLVAPLVKNSGQFIAKQIHYEKAQSLAAEADRALELIGRSIRMAGYRSATSVTYPERNKRSALEYISIQKNIGFGGSDALLVQHELSGQIDFDCIGNVLTKDRTKNGLAKQGFIVDRQTAAPKGARVNGGSLICQSLDRQGRLQSTTLMNGVERLVVEELQTLSGKAYRVRLEMTDGSAIHQAFERTFTTRNLS